MRSLGHLEVEGGHRASCEPLGPIHIPTYSYFQQEPSLIRYPRPSLFQTRAKLITNKSQRKAKLWCLEHFKPLAKLLWTKSPPICGSVLAAAPALRLKLPLLSHLRESLSSLGLKTQSDPSGFGRSFMEPRRRMQGSSLPSRSPSSPSL